MQEITPQIFIDTNYHGVVLGAINAPHGLVLIDSPLRPEDIRSWRASLLNISGGVERLLINLDAHPDRTLGTRGMECTVVGHDLLIQAFRNRPTTFKSQNSETGAAWEMIPSLGPIRWNPPEISFSEKMQIFWGSFPINLEHRPGPNESAIWVDIPEEKVLFVGDAVLRDQPPFLSHADLAIWITNLKELLTKRYRDYFLVGGRSGLVTLEDVRAQIKILERLSNITNQFHDGKIPPEIVEKTIHDLLKHINFPQTKQTEYIQRLRWGLTHMHCQEAQAAPLEYED
mgnify:CR=1 FL=1